MLVVLSLAAHALALAPPHRTIVTSLSPRRAATPLLADAAAKLSEYEQLQADLETAVKAEDYVAAAALRDKLASVAVDDEMAILSVNKEFYAAFTDGDYDRMGEVWAEDNVVCLHPQMPPIYGRDDVMASWEQILASARMDIRADNVRCMLIGSTAVVTCFEAVEGANALAATNVFAKTASGRWRMVHHQAAPMLVQPGALTPEVEI